MKEFLKEIVLIRLSTVKSDFECYAHSLSTITFEKKYFTRKKLLIEVSNLAVFVNDPGKKILKLKKVCIWNFNRF